MFGFILGIDLLLFTLLGNLLLYTCTLYINDLNSMHPFIFIIIHVHVYIYTQYIEESRVKYALKLISCI